MNKFFSFAITAALALPLVAQDATPAGEAPAQPREERRREEESRRRMVRIARTAGILLGMALVLGLMWYFLFIFNVAEVPLVAGMSQEDAIWTIEDSGFVPAPVRVYDEETEAGYVVGQEPTAGTSRKKGSQVQFTVSAGSKWVYLDDLTGLSVEEAEERLSAIGVQEVVREFVMSDAEVSTVISQDPEANWITRETPVTLRVSGERTAVPPLAGLTLEGAKALIEAERLTLGSVSEGYSADATAGTVIAQSLAPGAPVLVGDSVDLTICQEQPARNVYAVEYSLVVTLDAIRVRVELVTPSGNTVQSYNDVLNRGTYVITLESEEVGEHVVEVYFDDVLFEETKINFG